MQFFLPNAALYCHCVIIYNLSRWEIKNDPSYLINACYYWCYCERFINACYSKVKNKSLFSSFFLSKYNKLLFLLNSFPLPLTSLRLCIYWIRQLCMLKNFCWFAKKGVILLHLMTQSAKNQSNLYDFLFFLKIKLFSQLYIALLCIWKKTKAVKR